MAVRSYAALAIAYNC